MNTPQQQHTTDEQIEILWALLEQLAREEAERSEP
jgi:hypothetical protein